MLAGAVGVSAFLVLFVVVVDPRVPRRDEPQRVDGGEVAGAGLRAGAPDREG